MSTECYHHIHSILNNYILMTNVNKSQAINHLINDKDCLNFLSTRYQDETLQNTLDRIRMESCNSNHPITTNINTTTTNASSTERNNFINYCSSSTSTAPLNNNYDYNNNCNSTNEKRNNDWNISTENSDLSERRKREQDVNSNNCNSSANVNKLICQDYLEGFCRFENIFYNGKCKLKHEGRKLIKFQYSLKDATLSVFDTMSKKFKESFTVNVNVTSIQTITNTYLEHLYKLRSNEIINLRKNDPQLSLLEPFLYHGTSEQALSSIMTNGIYIPSDYNPDINCPVSGKLPISLCKNDCKLCTATRHVWGKCHMYGLGAYFADKSSKSDGYVSDLNGSKDHKKGRKMLICKIFPGKVFVIDSSLSNPTERHDSILPPKNYDSIYVKGKGSKATTGLEVINSEYILFNPYQCLPLYLITYDKG